MRIVKTNTQKQVKAKIYAEALRRNFDTKKLQDLKLRTENYKDFLFLKLKYPTIADIAYYEEIKKLPLKFPEKFKNNLLFVQNDSIIRYIQSLIDSHKERDYEKTSRLRKVLINSDRFSLDFVKPKLESKWQKLALKLRSII